MKRATSTFIYSVAALLVITSLAKLYSATGAAKVLDIPEALLPLSNRQTLVAVGVIELASALVLCISRNEKLKLALTAWLASNFMLYHIGIMLVAVGKPCPCLGSITEMLPLKPGTVDHMLTAVVLYLFCGSLFFLIAPWKRMAKPAGGDSCTILTT